jgi:hypothetical protein
VVRRQPVTPVDRPADPTQAPRSGTVVRLHLECGLGYVRDETDPANAYILAVGRSVSHRAMCKLPLGIPVSFHLSTAGVLNLG